jgi:hypothetical protein
MSRKVCYGSGMTTETTTQPAKLGRKPHGDAAMSAAERKRRSRERQQATGTKQFQLQVQGMHLQYVEALAARQEISTSAALRRILEPALHHYVFVMRHGEQMLANGATAEEVDRFLQTYWIPELPPMPESNAR